MCVVSMSVSEASSVSALRDAGGDGAVKPDWSEPGVEPALADVMNDPIVHLVMRRDSLTPDEVWSVVNTVRRLLKHDPAGVGPAGELAPIHPVTREIHRRTT